jgi:hypothetical protein
MRRVIAAGRRDAEPRSRNQVARREVPPPSNHIISLRGRYAPHRLIAASAVSFKLPLSRNEGE